MKENEKMKNAPFPQAAWLRIVMRYRRPSITKSTWQLVNTLIPYIGLVGLMFWSLQWSYLITLLLALPAAALAVRLFIISHDCGHRSFFASKGMNNFWGALTSMLVWTPYTYWRHEHARHHAGSGNLDRRGTGDIWTLTVSEYQALSRFHRMRYRLYRNPWFLFGVAPLYTFTVGYRFWARGSGKPERISVLRTNLVLVAVMALAHWTIGLKVFLLVQLPIVAIAASAGVWLFYIQHQFENVYWEKTDRWDFFRQAMAGSSFYNLPRWLAWCTANIGYHHVHHLSPGIPNYRLADCHRENPLFQEVNRITLATSLKSLSFRLWDEASRSMVGFKAAA